MWRPCFCYKDIIINKIYNIYLIYNSTISKTFKIWFSQNFLKIGLATRRHIECALELLTTWHQWSDNQSWSAGGVAFFMYCAWYQWYQKHCCWCHRTSFLYFPHPNEYCLWIWMKSVTACRRSSVLKVCMDDGWWMDGRVTDRWWSHMTTKTNWACGRIS